MSDDNKVEFSHTELLEQEVERLTFQVDDLTQIKKALEGNFGKGEKYIGECVQRLALDTEGIKERLNDDSTIHLLHAVMGMATEAGELLDMMKKHVFYGKDLDLVNLDEELGDSNWYNSIAIHSARMKGHVTSWERVWNKNTAKLTKRYGAKFDADKAENRDLDAEREILEAEATEGTMLEGTLNSDADALINSLNEGSICLWVEGQDYPTVELATDGNIYVKGNLVENDLELVNGMREWLLISSANRNFTKENVVSIFAGYPKEERANLIALLNDEYCKEGTVVEEREADNDPNCNCDHCECDK